MNNTLDRILLEINVYKKVGARSVKIKDTIIVKDLKDLMTVNSHGLREIKLNVSDLLIKGSSEFMTNMEEIYTEYSFSINNERKYKDIYDFAMSNSDYFNKNFPGEIKILNDMYQNIWNNVTLTNVEKYKENDLLEKAS